MAQRVKEVAVAFTRRYRQVEKTCPVCGGTFTGSPLRIYCNDRCAKRAGWQRHGEQYNATRKAKRSENG
jgi:hypothetical protein